MYSPSPYMDTSHRTGQDSPPEKHKPGDQGLPESSP